MRRENADRARTIKLRLTIRQRLPMVVGMFVGGSIGALLSALADDHVRPSALLLEFVFCAVAGLVAFLLSRNFGADLTPDHIDVRSLGRRIIPWNEIQGIRVEKAWFTQRIVVHEYNGRRTPLRAPLNGFLNWDRRFEEKYHTVSRCWAEANAIEDVADARPPAR